MTRLAHDFETFSECNIRESGASRYARHPTTEVLMCAYAFDDGPIRQWVPAEGQPMPRDLRDAMRDPGVIKAGWNASFEWNIWTHVLKVETPLDAWRCTMVLAKSLSLPGKLEKAGPVVKLSDDQKKMGEGTRLITKFCTPRKPTKTKLHTRATHLTDPAKWALFREYNIRDVEAERTIYRKLRRWELPDDEWQNWYMDREIAERGVPINMRVVDGALQIADAIKADRMQRLREITGLDNPNSVPQLLPWLQQYGYPYADLKKGHISKALLENLDNRREYKAVLELKQEISKTSVTKYKALKNATDEDGHIRNTIQFVGAGRTGRAAGRLYQVQNLPRPTKIYEKAEVQQQIVDDIESMSPAGFEFIYENPMGALSTALRPVVQAGPGRMIISADLNAIENRGVGWIAGDKKILKVFEENRCPYLDFATHMYGETYEKLAAEYDEGRGNKKKRTNSKPAVLGCGYALSGGEEKEDPKTGETIGTGLLGYAWDMGIMLTLEETKQAVKVWRETYGTTVKFWYELVDTFMYTIRTGRTSKAGPLKFDRSGPFVRMLLPSGRAIHYLYPEIEKRKAPWGAMKDTITYMNEVKTQWVRVTTHGGKILENATQAICRDLLYLAMRRARARGIDIRLHIHDEIVAISSEKLADKQLTMLTSCMTEPAPWAKDFPLGAAGSKSPIFIKD